MAILAVNAGSSTLKFSLHPLDGTQVLPSVLTGNIQGLEPGGQPDMGWTFAGQAQRQRLEASGADPFHDALLSLGALLTRLPGVPAIEAVAHRVVHGGAHYRESVVVDDAVLATLATLNSLAPLHQPHNLDGIRAFRKAFPQLPQVACFDTAFHATLPEVDYAFALPQALAAQGVRRYGFHGLSYRYIMDTLLEVSHRARGRVLMAHLGNGASLCATVDGKSVGTSMGFSALDGLMMGSRSGSIDPGVLMHLMRQGWSEKQISDLLYKQSGLLGVSGESADMRALHHSSSPSAQFAIALFCHRVQKEIAALTALTKGLDVIAFTGGIGEHDHEVRARVCEGLQYMGIHVDPRLNELAKGTDTVAIHTPHSYAEIWVVPTDEGRIAAEAACQVLAESSMEA